MKHPITSLHAIIPALKTAAVVTWIRGDTGHSRGKLDLFHESKTDDLRIITTIHFTSIRPPEVEVRKLSGYDPKKDSWTKYQSTPNEYFVSRKGEKALREAIKALAIEVKGVPNPSIFSFYPSV